MDESSEKDATSVRTRVRPGRDARGGTHLTHLVDDLLGDDLEPRLGSIAELAPYGKKAAEQVAGRLAKTHDAFSVDTLLTALEEIGRPAFEPLLNAFAHLPEARSAQAIEQIEDMARSLVYLGERKAIPAILFCLQRMKTQVDRAHDVRSTDRLQTARLRLLLLLAEMGVRDGLPEVLALLGDGRHRVPEPVVEALARIGDRRALLPLLKLCSVEKRVSEWGSRQIQSAFRLIARREHIGPGDPLFAGLAPLERETVDRWLPKARRPGRMPH